MGWLVKTLKAKSNFADNNFYSILRLFDVLPNFPFTTSETMRDYYLSPRYIRVAYEIQNDLGLTILKKLENIRKVSKRQRFIA